MRKVVLKMTENFKYDTIKKLVETEAHSVVSPVTIFPNIVRNELENPAVKTNLTIPAWLKEVAKERGVNYSKVLQAALMEYLNLESHPTDPSHRQT